MAKLWYIDLVGIFFPYENSIYSYWALHVSLGSCFR